LQKKDYHDSLSKLIFFSSLEVHTLGVDALTCPSIITLYPTSDGLERGNTLFREASEKIYLVV
jgi:hypothetical protein